MRKSILLFLSATLLSLVVFSSNLTVIFEPYSIFSYMEDFTLKGLAVDVIKGITKETGDKIDVGFTQWEEAYNRVNKGGNVALAAIAMNKERKKGPVPMGGSL